MTNLARRVLVIPTEVLTESGLGSFQGFQFADEIVLDQLLVHARFEPREAMEDDPRFKQLIPYVLIRSRGQLLSYLRGTSHAEQRLHRMRSLGIGGHIEPIDSVRNDRTGQDDPRATYHEALERELDEEIQIISPSEGPGTLLGFINDDSTPVGQVHLGVAHVLSLLEPRVQSREEGIVEPVFLSYEQILSDRDQYESWSQILIDQGPELLEL